MEVLHVSSNFRPCKEISPIMTHSAQVKPSTSVRDLGIVIDRHLTMREHINIICRNASLALRRIGKIRSFLNKATTEILVHAFVTSLLDNCNSLLYGVPDQRLNKTTKNPKLSSKACLKIEEAEPHHPHSRRTSLAPHQSKNPIQDYSPHIQRCPWLRSPLHLRTGLSIQTYTVPQIFHTATPTSTPTENQNLWRKDFCLQCPNPLELAPACPPLTNKSRTLQKAT